LAQIPDRLEQSVCPAVTRRYDLWWPDESGQNPGSGDHHHAKNSAAAIFNRERDLQAGYAKFIFQSVATG
jgi:hypothetical protein